jgi:hypothetical protein
VDNPCFERKLKLFVNRDGAHAQMGGKIQTEVNMGWEIARYEHPELFVRNVATGAEHRLTVRDDMTLESESSRSDLGDVRRVAIAYLAKLRWSRAA